MADERKRVDDETVGAHALDEQVRAVTRVEPGIPDSRRRALTPGRVAGQPPPAQARLAVAAAADVYKCSIALGGGADIRVG